MRSAATIIAKTGFAFRHMARLHVTVNDWICNIDMDAHSNGNKDTSELKGEESEDLRMFLGQ